MALAANSGLARSLAQPATGSHISAAKQVIAAITVAINLMAPIHLFESMQVI